MGLIRKIAETVEMSIAIPDSEVNVAKSIISNLNKLSKKYDAFNSLLDNMYTPFADAESISKESINKHKSAIWDFKKSIEETLSEVQSVSLICYKDLTYFASDTDINELKETFRDKTSQIDDDCRILCDALKTWEAEDFREIVVKSIENLKKQISESRELINDRIIKHINDNILDNSWVKNIGDKLQVEIKEREPFIKQLYDEREQKLRQMGF